MSSFESRGSLTSSGIQVGPASILRGSRAPSQSAQPEAADGERGSRPRRTPEGYFDATRVTSTWYCELNTAFRRSVVETKTCVGWISGMNGPDWFRRFWIVR